MKIHGYQAKQILAENKIPVPLGKVASSPEEARVIAKDLGGKAVVKAQVHAGGRGKAGGIKLVDSPRAAEQAAELLINQNLVTFQTGPNGVPIRKVLVEEAMDIEKEVYLGIVVDGQAGGVVIMASESGGIEIEEVANTNPDSIVKIVVDPLVGLQQYQVRKLSYGINIKSSLISTVNKFISRLYSVFVENDFSLAEINPLAITSDGRVLALDAKINLEDDALFRHEELNALRDTDQEDPLEVRASNYGIQYIKLDGDVGCMVNGAGLAMATMDIILKAGSQPANFLDVGGGATEEKVAEAFRIILADSKVKNILINIFGGILRCDVAAQGIVDACKSERNVNIPIVMLMRGTNVEEGKKILAQSNLNIDLVNNLKEAAAAVNSKGI
jgi:succinyl-CoA synthetase beta subunit